MNGENLESAKKTFLKFVPFSVGIALTLLALSVLTIFTEGDGQSVEAFLAFIVTSIPGVTLICYGLSKINH